jgi:hypothetical protein
MVQDGRRSKPTQEMAHWVPMTLVALMLALSALCRAEEGTAAVPAPESVVPAPVPATPDSTNSVVPRARAHRAPVHRTAGQGIDETVQRMSRGLALDAEQQAKLRGILWDQYRQVKKVHAGNSQAGVDWAGATLAIVDQTKARIREMLSEEQRKKYSTDVPRELTAPAQADLQHWMELQQSQRQQDEAESK